AAGAPATPRSCWSCSTPSRPATTRCSRSSGRATTRPRGCARATTWARSTARRSTWPTTTSARRPRRRATPTRSACRRPGTARSRRRSRRPASSSTPSPTTSSTSPRTRAATAGWAARASAARSGWARRRPVRHSAGRRARGDVARDDGVREHARAGADRHAAQHAGATVQDGVVLDADRRGGDALPADRLLGVGVDMVEVDEHVAALQPAPRADLHALVGGDDAVGAEPCLRPDGDAAGADVHAAALAEPRAGPDLQTRAGRRVEADARTQVHAGLEADAAAPAQLGGEAAGGDERAQRTSAAPAWRSWAVSKTLVDAMAANRRNATPRTVAAMRNFSMSVPPWRVVVRRVNTRAAASVTRGSARERDAARYAAAGSPSVPR